MKDRLRVALSPPPEPGRLDTGLRFTDVLFGFVIRELFVRLQNWGQLANYTRWQLIVGTALVLGSWIGFRRSLNRPMYEVKFFNLPMFRFLADQVMVIQYFRIAVLTPGGEAEPPAAKALVETTIELLVFVFLLYVVWDLLGIWMDKSKVRGVSGDKKPKYPVVKDARMTGDEKRADWVGFLISAAFLAALGVLWWVTEAIDADATEASWLFGVAFLLLLAYRTAKEVRTSWRSLRPAA